MNRFDRSVGVVVASTFLAVTAGSLHTRAADKPSDVNRPTIERRLGEEEQIRRRQEWFFSTRSQGVRDADERASLRRKALEELKGRLAVQRAARESRGLTQNPWTTKGPSPSEFNNWAFGTVAGRATAMDADWAAGILYLGTAAGGLWKSTDDGVTWTQLLDSAGTMAVGAVAVDPNDPNVLWVGTGDNLVGCESYFGIGLLRSADGGQTWQARNGSGGNTLQDLATFADVVVDPRDSDHLVVGGRYRQCQDGSGFEGGIYTTTDGGLNWTVRLAPKQVYEVKQDPTLLDIFWAATDDGIYKSVDNGVTWVQQTASSLPANGVGRCELAIAPSNGKTVYALFASGPNLWSTKDGGAPRCGEWPGSPSRRPRPRAPGWHRD